MRPARGLLLVKPIEPAETYAGGSVIVPEIARQRVTMWQCECVAVGEPEICGDSECEKSHGAIVMREEEEDEGKYVRIHPLIGRRGDWLLVKPRSYLDTGDPERKLWLVRQRDVLGSFRE